MEFLLISEIIRYAGIVVGGIFSLYLLFCWLYVWGNRSFLRRLDDIGWKRVDYAWIIVGALGLVLQLIQIGLDSKVASLNMEKTFGQLDAQTLNIAADELSGPAICLPASSGNTSDNAPDLAVELAGACKKYQVIRPAQPRSTVVDMNVFKYFEVVYADADKMKSPLLAAKLKRFKQAFAEYEQQMQSLQDARNIARTYEQYLLILKIIATILLVVAVALRLAKVTGEIRIKTHPIEKNCAEAVHAGELTVAKLNELEDKINNIASSVKLKFNFMLLLILIMGALAVASLCMVLVLR